MSNIDDLEREVKKELVEMNLPTEEIDTDFLRRTCGNMLIKAFSDIAHEYQPLMVPQEPSANQKYVQLRTVVLSIFAQIESEINYLLKIKLDRNYEQYPRIDDGTEEAISILLDEKNFSTKIKVLNILYNKENIDLNLLHKLADIRNAFAHSLPISDNKYEFEKSNIVLNFNAFDNFREKSFKLTKELRNISTRQPELLRLVVKMRREINSVKEQIDKREDKHADCAD